MKNLKSKLIVFFGVLLLLSCTKQETTQDDLKNYFKNHRIGSSSDYAVIKNGDDYLLTIHGYMDDKQSCEDIIKPLNEDPKLSVMPGTYSCIKLN